MLTCFTPTGYEREGDPIVMSMFVQQDGATINHLVGCAHVIDPSIESWRKCHPRRGKAGSVKPGIFGQVAMFFCSQFCHF